MHLIRGIEFRHMACIKCVIYVKYIKGSTHAGVDSIITDWGRGQ